MRFVASPRQPHPNAAEHVLHMQKALDQMNLQIHRVLDDITGLSGLRILDAILAGERDTVRLTRLCHARVKSNQDPIAKSLEGDYRPEHLFALRQSLAAFRYYQSLVTEVDHEIQRGLQHLATATTAQPTPPKRTKASPYQRGRYEPKGFDLRTELYRIFGIDLTNVPGIQRQDSADHLVRDRHRCSPLPQRFGLCILAGTLPGEQDQRR